MTTKEGAAAERNVDRQMLEQIKVKCLSTGIRIDSTAASELSAMGERLTVHEYPTTGGITLELPGGVYINAPFDEWFCERAEVTLTTLDGRLALASEGKTVPVVRHLPLPGYLDAVDVGGRPVTDVVMSHADRLRLSPLRGCAYDCGFCDLPTQPYRLRPVDQLLEAMEIAQRDPVLPVRHALISGGSPRRGHIEDFQSTCLSIIAATSMPVDLMMSPISELGFVNRLVDAGVHGFSVNLELFGERESLLALRAKHRVTRREFEPFVTRCVELLGTAGRVRSLLIVGLEPAEQTLAGVAYLASLGCSPVLSPFRPTSAIKLNSVAPPSASLLGEVLDGAREIVRDTPGVHLGPDCVACQHNTLTFPWDLPAVDMSTGTGDRRDP